MCIRDSYEVASNLNPGTVVMKDTWIADIVKPNELKIEAYVQESELSLIKMGLTGYFYPGSLSDKRIPIKVSSIDTLNTSELNCRYSTQVKEEESFVDTPCYNSNELGGDIATYLTEDGKFVPVKSIYRILLVPEDKTDLEYIQRGVIVLNTKPRSYASRVFYWLNKLLIQQSGF